METLKHTVYGKGEIIAREGNIATVRFDRSGCEMHIDLPWVYANGLLKLEGSLKDEIEAAVKAKREAARLAREAQTQARLQAQAPVAVAPAASRNRARNAPVRVAVKGTVELAFEEFLKASKYKEFTDKGNPSTVYSYTGSIKNVLKMEGIGWHTLIDKIDEMVSLYGRGGAKEAEGSKSNDTVINALCRFKDFVNSSLGAAALGGGASGDNGEE